MYGFNRKKILFYSIVTAISFFALTNSNLAVPDGDFRFMETSFVSILRNAAEEYNVQPPDFGIENVSLKKISDPTDRFNYYKYSATVVIKNYGGNIKNAKLTLQAGDEQRYIFLNNDVDGFSLRKNQNYIVEGYDVLFDGNYNGGKITLEIKSTDNQDYYAGNNKYDVDISEMPAKIEALGVEKILDDGTFVLDYAPRSPELNVNKFEVYTADVVDAGNDEEKYAETVDQYGTIYGYHRIKNSSYILKSENFKLKSTNDSDTRLVKFGDDPFEDETTRFIHIRSTNPENGYYAVSNLLKFSPQKNLDRAAFAKLFVDYSDIPVFDDGENYFDDVSPDAWYGPYAKTLYNLGLIKNDTYKYNPDNPITRGEVLRVVLDYFDVDLVAVSGGPHFQDITSNNYLYPYAEALSATGNGGVFGENFNANAVATKNYLKYLINEYKENS